MGSVAGAAVELTHRMQSLAAARHLCDSLLSVPSPGGAFFQAALRMELAAVPDSPEAVKRAQRLFEVRRCGHLGVYIPMVACWLCFVCQAFALHDPSTDVSIILVPETASTP